MTYPTTAKREQRAVKTAPSARPRTKPRAPKTSYKTRSIIIIIIQNWKNTHNEEVSNKASNNSNGDPDTSLGEQDDIDVDTNESVQLSDASSQNNLELVNDRSDMLDSAVLLGNVV